jgi:hypothetical protein
VLRIRTSRYVHRSAWPGLSSTSTCTCTVPLIPGRRKQSTDRSTAGAASCAGNEPVLQKLTLHPLPAPPPLLRASEPAGYHRHRHIYTAHWRSRSLEAVNSTGRLFFQCTTAYHRSFVCSPPLSASPLRNPPSVHRWYRNPPNATFRDLEKGDCALH